MIALVTYIRLSAFEKEGTMRDPSGCRAEGCADFALASFAVTCDSFRGTSYPVDGDKKEETC